MVLDICLHTNEGHGVAIGGDGESGDQETIEAGRCQGAQGDIGRAWGVCRRCDHEERGEGVSVRIEIGFCDADGIGVGPTRIEIDGMKDDIAENAAMMVPGGVFTGIAGKGLAKAFPRAVGYFTKPGANIAESAIKGTGKMLGNIFGNAVVPFASEGMDAAIYGDDDADGSAPADGAQPPQA